MSMKWIRLFSACLLAGSSVAATPAPVAPKQPGFGLGPACTIYEDANFAGRAERLERGAAIANVGPAWNDRISSIQCRPDCEIEAFEHVDYRGAVQHFSGTVGFVGPGWNDRISALRVRCERHAGGGPGWGPQRGPACVVFEDANYQGRREEYREGHEQAFVGAFWNDRISAVQCRPRCRLTAWEHANFQGQSVTYVGDRPFVGPWNDRISSVSASCT